MKMVARGVYCATNKADHIALLYLLDKSYADGRTMRIKGFQPIAVIEFDVV